MHCPKCKSTNKIKSGFNSKKSQRYKCKDCGCHYSKSSSYRVPEEQRALAIKLYLEGMGFRGIGRITGFSNVTIMKWVRKLGDNIQHNQPVPQGRVTIMELDELWHFIGKKRQNAGSGLRMTVTDDASVPFGLVAVMQPRVGNF